MISIAQVWERFQDVSTVRFKSKSHTGIGWTGAGSGVVAVTETSPEVLLFTESGSWVQESGQKIRFSNVFRWTKSEDRLHLEHLRFGADNPVFLFEMTRGVDEVWREINPHPCNDDCYRASMRFESEQIFVNWRVQGPKRDEIIEYIYL